MADNMVCRQTRHYQRDPEAGAARARAWKQANPEKVKASRRKSYLANAEKRRAYAAAYRLAHPEKVAESSAKQRATPEARAIGRQRCRRWKAENRDKVSAYAREWLATPGGKLSNRVRASLRRCLTGGKSSRKFAALGYTLEDLRSHLERQFVKGMSWANMDQWHIDHIVPLSSFAFTDKIDAEFIRAWALPNLRPLWAAENIAKSDKRTLLL